MSENKGIELFKENAVSAIIKEYKKLDDMNVLVPENPMCSHPN